MSIGSLISTTNQETELRTKYKSLLKLVVEKSICSRTILLERLDPEDIVPVIYQNRSEDMMRVINRYKRVNYYTQNNHISFYDQSEGYVVLSCQQTAALDMLNCLRRCTIPLLKRINLSVEFALL